MSKTVIGRRLNTLMGPAPRGGGASPFAAPETTTSDTGVRSLLRGQAPDSTPPRRVIPRWYLFGADLLLVAMALIVMYKSPVPFTGWGRVFGVGAVVLGAGLALVATCVKEPKGS